MDYNKDDDFFGQELEKRQEEQRKAAQNGEGDAGQSNTKPADNFYQAVPQWDDSKPPRKTSSGLTIALLCIGLVIVFALGIVIGGLFKGNNGAMLNDVLEYVRYYYYKDLTDEQWEQALASGGTGILNGLGDPYGRLLTPQEYYDLLYPVAETVTGPSYGFSFQLVEGLGIYVYETVTDSNAYGQLKQGDLIVQLSDLVNQYGVPVKYSDGTTVTVVNTNDITTSELTYIVGQSNQMTAKVVSDQDIKQITLTRNEIKENNYRFVEFYLDTGSQKYTNVSLTNADGCLYNTMELRSLDQLGTNVGYIRLKEFSETAATEFKTVLQEMKLRAGNDLRLIVDLKGNPGGSVDIAASIASMLAHERNLPKTVVSEKRLVADNGLRITNLVGKVIAEDYYSPSQYSEFFSADQGMIVVWTDGNSASASEMLTGVLTDYRTAVQMGTQTYGKGIAQSAIKLPYSGEVVTNEGVKTEGPWALYFTIASYYSPLGNNIHGVGYTPETQYNNLTEYSQLVNATNTYFGR